MESYSSCVKKKKNAFTYVTIKPLTNYKTPDLQDCHCQNMFCKMNSDVNFNLIETRVHNTSCLSWKYLEHAHANILKEITKIENSSICYSPFTKTVISSKTLWIGVKNQFSRFQQLPGKKHVKIIVSYNAFLLILCPVMHKQYEDILSVVLVFLFLFFQYFLSCSFQKSEFT